MLYFASYSGDSDSSIVRETWARLIDQALSRGGIAEACAVLKRAGSHVFPGDGAILPLDTLCLHLEKAAQVKGYFLQFLLPEPFPRMSDVYGCNAILYCLLISLAPLNI